MKKSAKLTAVYALIMDLPLSIVVTFVSLVLAHNLSVPTLVLMSCIAYVVTFFVNFLHAENWGFAFAVKRSQPGTLKFGLLINAVVAAVFTIILDLIMTYIGVVVFGHQGMAAFAIACVAGFIPCYVASFIVAFLWNNVADGLSRKICNEPAPEMH